MTPAWRCQRLRPELYTYDAGISCCSIGWLKLLLLYCNALTPGCLKLPAVAATQLKPELAHVAQDRQHVTAAVSLKRNAHRLRGVLLGSCALFGPCAAASIGTLVPPVCTVCCSRVQQPTEPVNSTALRLSPACGLFD